MRKPLIALGLIVSSSLGAVPVAQALAAPPLSKNLNSNSTHLTSNLSQAKGRAVSGAAIVQTAMKYLGYPYTATGNSPSTGFSCIGFVSFVYRSNGIPLPGDLGNALAYAPRVPFSDLRPGDILYFQNTIWNGLSHAAIYIGGGKFIHAEYYNRGVVISSFRNDPVDGSTYWISKYLGANRPWNGAAGIPSIPGASPGGSGIPSSTSAVNVGTGPSGVVINASGGLRVHAAPSKSASLVTIAPNGTSVTIVGKKSGWYQVQLSNGTTGWVMASYIRVAHAATGTAGANGTAGTTTAAPARAGFPTSRPSLTVHVNGLRVHMEPSAGSAVITTMSRGQRVQVLGHHSNWVKVRLGDGTVGWIMGSYTSIHKVSANRASSTFRGTHTQTAVNVRVRPSRQSSVVTVVSPGGALKIMGWSNGWAHVRLSDGTTGWVSSSVLGNAKSAGASPTYQSRSFRHASRRSARSSAAGRSVLTAGVRLHARPGVKSRVIGLAGTGTHVRVIGYSRGWARVRLPGGQTGYVLGSYVR